MKTKTIPSPNVAVSPWLIAMCLAFVISSSSGKAALIGADPFLNGSNPAAGEYLGKIPGQNPAVAGWVGAWGLPWWGSPDNLYSALPGLTYGSLITSGGRAEATPFTRTGRALATPYNDTSSGTVYLSFLMQVPDANISHYRAFELHDGAGLDDGGNRKLQLGINGTDLYGSGNFGLRLFNNDSFKLDLGASNTDVNLFVLKFSFSTDFDGDTLTVWSNPSNLGGAEPAGGQTLSGFNMSFDRTTFAHFESGFGNPSMSFDELRLGTTWASVTPIPEPASVGLLALGALMLALRRRTRE
jgi:hypothetical protein